MFATKWDSDVLQFPLSDHARAKVDDRAREVRGFRDGTLTPKLSRFLNDHSFAQPTLVVDLDEVSRRYGEMAVTMPFARIFYAVKANPAPEVLIRLAEHGANFDVASRGEIDLCLSLGVEPERLSYGNTIKRKSDIADAWFKGVRQFAFDSDEELEKIAEVAPGASVHCRVLMECVGADWPLSKKFGCTPEMALRLMRRARDLGLDPAGISFHVGSQQTDLTQWDMALGLVAGLFRRLAGEGITLRVVNVGGGFPSRYRNDVPTIDVYGRVIDAAVSKHFGTDRPNIIVEPGRYIVGDAGVIQAEVVLVSKKDDADDLRWVFLDIGKFSGLAETMDEAIKYRIETDRDGGPSGPVVLAGPTCDSADILYEKTIYDLPLDLRAGDKVRILATGAYTTTYSSVGFNGFAPLGCICI